MQLFALEDAKDLAADVAQLLDTTVCPHEERTFEDGEHKSRPLVSVRDEDVFVLSSLAASAEVSSNDKLVKLLFFLAACREHGARRVTAVTPYLAYSRKDRQTKRHDPVITRYVAQLFEAVGTARVMTLEVHNLAAFQNAFRCETVHLDCRQLFLPVIRRIAQGSPITILSPDSGGVKRAQLLKEKLEAETDLEIGFGLLEKRRSRGIVSGELFAGDVSGTHVFVVDDMISTGGTLLRAARACRQRGATAVHAVVTHGLFAPGVEDVFASGVLDRVVVTNSVPKYSEAAAYAAGRLEVVSVAPLFADAVRRLAEGGPIADLLRSDT